MEKSMVNNFSLLAYSAIMLAVSACCDQNTTPQVVKYPHIERVFMHDPGQYSFLYKDESNGQLISVSRRVFGSQSEHRAKYILIPDVKKDDFCWAEIDMGNYLTTIHIHDASEIIGGGWNHGKFGSGSTAPIE